MKNTIRGTQETVGFARHLRTTQTDTEKMLWRKLRAKKFCEYKFRRQVPIGPYIADFACVKRKVIVEVDGYVHEMKKSHDRERDCFLRQHGFHILRLCNEDVRQNLEGILEKLLEFLSTPLPDPLPSGEGGIGVPIVH